MSMDELRESSSMSMTDEQLRSFLTEQGVGILGVVDESVPYLVPLSFGFDGDDTLYFVFLLFGDKSRKEQLCDQNQRARFLVYSADSVHEWKSVSLVGQIDQVADDEWDSLQDAMKNAWHPDVFRSASPMRGIEGYRFQIEEWTAIQSGGVGQN